MPVKVTTEEDYYVSQDEIWDWDDGSVSTSADYTDFTFCLDSTDEDGKKSNDHCDSSSEDPGNIEKLEVNKKKKRKTKTIFSLELEQHETNDKKNLKKAPEPESCGGFGDFKVIGKDSLKLSKDKENVFQCKVHLPYKSPSRLILLQKQQHDTLFTCLGTEPVVSPEGPYFNTFLLDNPTSSTVAFKIFCNSTAWTHFTVKPALGVISPNSRVSIRIKTKMDRKSGGQISNLDVHWDQFTVKFFPVYFNNKEECSKYLKLLSKQSPHMIHCCHLPRVVLWDASDLHSMLDSLATCEEITSDALEKQLYHRYVTHAIPVARRNAPLNKQYFQILAANQELRRSLSLVYYASKAQELFLFVVFCALTFIFVLPHL